MATNFFDLVKDGFFNPFSGPDRRLNYELLKILYEKMSQKSFLVPKDDLVEWLEDFLDNSPIVVYDDETEEEEKNNREAALHKIRYFTKYGWLLEDYDGLNVVYQLDDKATIMLKAMIEAVLNDSKPMEYTTYALTIYTSLINFEVIHAVEGTEVMYDNAKNLNIRLNTLNVQVKKFLNSLLKNNEATPREILQTLYIDYQNKVVLKSFKFFREKDNPSKYKGTIISKIDDLLSYPTLDLLVKDYIKKKKNEEYNDDSESEAREFFETRLSYIRNLFEDIEELLDNLDRKNSNYVNTAKSRLNFLLNEEANIEGKLVEILKSLANVSDEFYDNDNLRIYSGNKIDSKSLYTPRITRTRAESNLDTALEDLATIEEIERERNRFDKENLFSCHSINSYIMKFLNDKEEIHSKDIAVSEYDDLIRLFLVKLYSQNTSIDYKVRFLNDLESDNYYDVKFYNDKTGNNDVFRLKDFIIERK